MIRLKLITLNGIKIDRDVYEVMIPTKAGEIAVYGGHAPIVSVLANGIIHIRNEKRIKDADRETIAAYGGTLKVLNNELIILADEIEDPEHLKEDEVKKALNRAHELKKSAKDKVEIDKAQEMIDRHTVRLKIAGLRRHKRR